nr:hypothetical protein [Tanacetum cinerariifolium]
MGGNGGTNPWSFRLEDDFKLTEIKTVSQGGCVYSIRFAYLDNDKVTHNSKQYGGDADYGTRDILIIPDGEKITGISGTVGSYDGITVITSLSFKVGTIKNGPYGTPSGTPFSLPVNSGDVTGFFGNHGVFLDSLGVILSYSN